MVVQTLLFLLPQVKPEMKLPCLYLMDSVVKNHPHPYRELFEQNLVSNFAHVFSSTDVKTRAALYKLRMTWGEVFSQEKLRQLDLKVKTLDPKWPVVGGGGGGQGQGQGEGQGQQQGQGAKNIHINPAVFNRNRVGTNFFKSSSPSWSC